MRPGEARVFAAGPGERIAARVVERRREDRPAAVERRQHVPGRFAPGGEQAVERALGQHGIAAQHQHVPPGETFPGPGQGRLRRGRTARHTVHRRRRHRARRRRGAAVFSPDAQDREGKGIHAGHSVSGWGAGAAAC